MIRPKKCSEEGCNGNSWKKGKCRIHMEKKEVVKDDSMKDMFMDIWNSMPHPRRCFETDKILSSTPNTMMFHHVLPKSKYPQYKLCKWNIVVVDPTVHARLEMNINTAPKVKQLMNDLKRQYNEN